MNEPYWELCLLRCLEWKYTWRNHPEPPRGGSPAKSTMWQALICSLHSRPCDWEACSVWKCIWSPLPPPPHSCPRISGAPRNETISSEVPGFSRRSGTRIVVTSEAVWLRGPRDSLESNPRLYSARVISWRACLAIAAAVFLAGRLTPNWRD